MSESVEHVMAELASHGSEKTAAIYRRHGASGAMFGVSFAALKALAKRIKRDQALAEALWQTGNLDARTLATMLAEPKRVAAQTLDAWLDGLDYYTLVDLVAGVATASPHARERCDAWRTSELEYVGRAGWSVVAHLAVKDKKLDDTWLRARLDEIAAGLREAPNRKREAMHSALIAIGGRNDALQTPALELARALGPVEIDYGDTACKTPDAVEYIEKMAARRATRK